MISGNLFTRDYLLDGIERTAQWKSLPDKSVEALRHRLETIARNFLKIARPNEAETEKEFIYPVIEALGWTDYQVQQILSQKGRKQVPDALLFADAAAKTLAVVKPSSGSVSSMVWPCSRRNAGIEPRIAPTNGIPAKRVSPRRKCSSI